MGNYRLALIIICIVFLGTSACGINEPAPIVVADQALPPQPEIILVSAPLDSTATPTPFLPLPLTPTPNATFTPTPSPTAKIPQLAAASTPINWAYYPPPVVPAPIAIPPPMGVFNQPNDQINILLMGSDVRPRDGSFRTDVLILVTINFKQKTVNLTSFPRDLFVYIPGWTMERINTAQLRGGFELTALTFEYNFGVRPDHWALINFAGFVDLVDTVGGIDVDVEQELKDYRDGYPSRYIVKPGVNHMDGETALWYVRSRHSSSDFDRTRRQQEVLLGIFYKMFSFNMIAKVPELYSQFKQSIQTDMSLDDILSLVPIAAEFRNSNNIHGYAVGPEHVTAWTNPYNGAQVLLPNQYLIRPLMAEALNAK